MKNRDPRDAWMIVQRICGVCTTTHALSSVRAAESALNIDVPVNAQYIRKGMNDPYPGLEIVIHIQAGAGDLNLIKSLSTGQGKTCQLFRGIST